MTTSWYYICDRCGSIVTITDAAIPEDEHWACADCGSETMWEVTDKAHALAHSEHIRAAHRTGLLRSAR